METVETSKKKHNKYYMKRNFNRKLCVEPNLKGFLCSCNYREKECIRESYKLLNQYADKLYTCATTSAEDEQVANEDIDELLSKEISELKQDIKRFQAVESGARNFPFIRTTLEDPVELAEAIVRDIQETKNRKFRFLLRLIPVEITCKARVDDIGRAFGQIVEKHFKNKAQTFSIIFNHRNNNVITRDEIIKLIAIKVFETRIDHQVDLKGAEISVIVEIIKGFAFLSVIPNYLKYKKFNLSSICDNE